MLIQQPYLHPLVLPYYKESHTYLTHEYHRHLKKRYTHLEQYLNHGFYLSLCVNYVYYK